MRILEDVDAVHVVNGEIDPDDLAFGRYKPVRSYKCGLMEDFIHAYQLAEAFIDGYNQRLGDLLREESPK